MKVEENKEEKKCENFERKVGYRNSLNRNKDISEHTKNSSTYAVENQYGGWEESEIDTEQNGDISKEKVNKRQSIREYQRQ